MGYKVSVIVRTRNRPQLLRKALHSLRDQTEPSFEVVVIEDGPPDSEKVIEEFPDLAIHYHATRENVGRTRAANIGLSKAQGKYLNFLDDDDLLLPHHIETLLRYLEENDDVDAVHAAAIERPFDRSFKDKVKYTEPLDKETIFYRNMMPIQAAMFRRRMYEKHGGMDESLAFLEDWDLWIRYSMHGEFGFVNDVTSIYHVPADRKIYKERKKVLKNYEKVIWAKYRSYMTERGYRRPNIVQRAIGKLLRYQWIHKNIK